MKVQLNISATTPASMPSSALSVSSWRTRRSRLAPSERRMRSSFWRDAARANCRLATLAQAMTSTMPTATMTSRTAYFNPPDNRSGGRGNGDPGQTNAVAGLPHSECGSCRALSWPASTVISARACSILTPGARRPRTRQHRFSRSRSAPPAGWSSGERLSGSQKSGTSRCVPTKLRGVIPITVRATPFSRMDLPSSAGSPANLFCQ